MHNKVRTNIDFQGNKVEMSLDRKRAYRVKDLNETWFEFRWETSPALCWRTYRKFPGQEHWMSVGEWSEADVVRYISEQRFRLNEDDLLDFELSLHSGGVEKWFEAARQQKEGWGPLP
jgi:hypothetical protein